MHWDFQVPVLQDRARGQEQGQKWFILREMARPRKEASQSQQAEARQQTLYKALGLYGPVYKVTHAAWVFFYMLRLYMSTLEDSKPFWVHSAVFSCLTSINWFL